MAWLQVPVFLMPATDCTEHGKIGVGTRAGWWGVWGRPAGGRVDGSSVAKVWGDRWVMERRWDGGGDRGRGSRSGKVEGGGGGDGGGKGG